MLTKEPQYVFNPGQPYEAPRAYSRTCPPPAPSSGLGGGGAPSGGGSQNCYTVPIYGPAGGASGAHEGGTNVIGYEMFCNDQLVSTWYV